MPPLFGVKFAEGCNAAPTIRQVGAIAMTPCDRAWSEIEGCRAPYAVGEVSLEGRVVVEELVEVVFVVHIKLWGPCGEGRAREPCNSLDVVVREQCIELLAVDGGVGQIARSLSTAQSELWNGGPEG